MLTADFGSARTATVAPGTAFRRRQSPGQRGRGRPPHRCRPLRPPDPGGPPPAAPHRGGPMRGSSVPDENCVTECVLRATAGHLDIVERGAPSPHCESAEASTVAIGEASAGREEGARDLVGPRSRVNPARHRPRGPRRGGGGPGRPVLPLTTSPMTVRLSSNWPLRTRRAQATMARPPKSENCRRCAGGHGVGDAGGEDAGAVGVGAGVGLVVVPGVDSAGSGAGEGVCLWPGGRWLTADTGRAAARTAHQGRRAGGSASGRGPRKPGATH